MKEPQWIEREECMAIHEMMLARYGGAAGIRDLALLEQVLARPREQYAGGGSLFHLAASYASGFMTTAPFVSGDALTGFLLAVTFLRINGFLFTGRDLPSCEETLALASGQSSESHYARFLKCNSRAPDDG